MDIEPDCARLERRTNMFVLADMSATSAFGPVKIRNLSPLGALIEGEALPAVDDAFELKRGSLFASGQVVWRDGNKAGVRFDGSIEVNDWLPITSFAQQKVDGTFCKFKNGRADHSTVRTKVPSDHSVIDPDRLKQLAAALDILADDLATDLGVVLRYSHKLQSLDLAAQVLRRLAEIGIQPSDYSDVT